MKSHKKKGRDAGYPDGCVKHYGSATWLNTVRVIQSVPLATEPGVSLIILTRMKILQRNLNRSTFVVWEMKRNVSAVCVC